MELKLILDLLQSIGVGAALVFGYKGLKQATDALNIANRNNDIAINNSVHDLLMEINQTAIQIALSDKHRETELTVHQRLHLLRLHYFCRVHELYVAGFIDDIGLKAEAEYLKWSSKQTDFLDVWQDFHLQYRSDCRDWIDETLDIKRVTIEEKAVIRPGSN